MKVAEIIEFLDGCEVLSIQFEGVVAINKGVVIRAYDQSVVKMTGAKWKTLWAEHCEDEGITYMVHELKKEFADMFPKK